MATLGKITSSLVRNFDKKLVLLSQNHVQVVCSASMSQFPKYFIQPTFRKEELDALYASNEVQKKVHVPARPPLNDHTCSQFYNQTTRKFVNHIMRMGKKELARTLVEKAFEKMKRVQIEKYNSLPADQKEGFKIKDPDDLLQAAIENAKPIMILTSIKRGGTRYQVPIPISDNQATILAYKWLIEAGKDKDSHMRFYDKLAFEILEAANNTGRVVKKKLDLHRQCEANRAYAHYRWN